MFIFLWALRGLHSWEQQIFTHMTRSWLSSHHHVENWKKGFVESQLKVLVHNKSAWVHWWMNHELSPGGLLIWNINVKLEALNADTPCRTFPVQRVHSFTLNTQSECVKTCERSSQVQSPVNSSGLRRLFFRSDVPKCSAKWSFGGTKKNKNPLDHLCL